jgi:hypothetical protein
MQAKTVAKSSAARDQPAIVLKGCDGPVNGLLVHENDGLVYMGHHQGDHPIRLLSRQGMKRKCEPVTQTTLHVDSINHSMV